MTTTPTGTVTFLFTDIEGSTMRWEQYPNVMKVALSRHNAHLRRAIEQNGGYVFKIVGDAFCAAFHTATEAAVAALEAQRALQAEDWTDLFQDAVPQIRIRMAIHTGTADERDGDYFGPPLNRVARLLSSGHGGQILLSLPSEELVRDSLPAGVMLLDLGEHRLKDLQRRERVFQLVSPDMQGEFQPLKTLDTHPNNLPLQLTPFVGRARELPVLSNVLLREDVRLLTLTGPGGTGKTRLALQAAAELIDNFKHGAFFVSLATISSVAPLSDPNLVANTIAQVLGVREVAGQPILQSLQDYLSDKQILLILDNFEQVVASSPVVNDLLAAAPEMKIIVTTREVLHLRGEKEFPVPPLQLPNRKHLPRLEILSQYEALALFIQRAMDVKPDFHVTHENAPAIAEICHRLDGLPLAIELAATRIRLLPPQAILARLESRFSLLTGGARDLPARQQTLRGTIEWSYDLLNQNDKALLRRLAAFAGGRTLEAAEAICNFGDSDLDTLEGISSLIEKSLLQPYEGALPEPTFRMLESIHEYARERLEEDPAEALAVKERHSRFFLGLAEEAEPHLRGPGQAEWLSRLEAEHDNLRVALKWALDNGEVEVALRLTSAMCDFWHRRGYITEGREWLSKALGPSMAHADRAWSVRLSSARAKALNGAGVLAFWQGDYATARSYNQQSLELAKELNDLVTVARALNGLGDVARFRSELDQARAYFTEGLAVSKEVDDRWSIAKSLSNLGYLAFRASNHTEAHALHEESLAIYRELGDKSEVSGALWRLALVAREEGNYALARSMLDEALVLSRDVGDKFRIALSINSLGELKRLQNHYPAARSFYEEALIRFRDLGYRSNIALTLHNLGHTVHRQGDLEQARNIFWESLTTCYELGDKEMVAGCMAGLGGVAASSGQPVRAAKLLAACEALLKSVSAFLDPADRIEYDRNMAAAQGQLDEQSWQQAWLEGQAMSLEEAIATAFEESNRLVTTPNLC